MTDFDISRPPLWFDERLKRGQSELTAFAKNITTLAQLSGLAPSRPLRAEAPPPKLTRRQRKPRAHIAGGLFTPAQAAAKLGCSVKTLNGHVAAGELRYVIIGHGKQRSRKIFTDADLDEFIANQTRKVTPCPSDATRGRRSGSTISKSKIIAFSEAQKRRRDAKPKR